MATRPEDLPRWATTTVVSPVTNKPNVLEPTSEKKDVGWQALEAGGRQFLNWLFRQNYRWSLYFDERFKWEFVADGAGAAALTDIENTFISIHAVDTTNLDNYVIAQGYKTTAAPNINIIDSNVLGLGTVTADDIPITGGTASDIKMFVKLQQEIQQTS